MKKAIPFKSDNAGSDPELLLFIRIRNRHALCQDPEPPCSLSGSGTAMLSVRIQNHHALCQDLEPPGSLSGFATLALFSTNKFCRMSGAQTRDSSNL